MTRDDKKHKPSKQLAVKSSFSLPPFAYYLIIVGGLIIFFYFHILTQKYYFWDDFMYQWYPFYSFAKDCFKNLQLPMWNPYSFGGTPFSNDLLLIYYPLLWVFLFINGAASVQYLQLEIMILFHLLLIGACAYLFFKEYKIDWRARILGAIVWIFSGYLSLRIGQTYPMIFFPWSLLTFYFLVRILNHQRLIDVVLGGLCFGVAVLGGHPQLILYYVYAVVIYCIYSAFTIGKENIKNWLPKAFGQILLLFIIGFGIGMLQYYMSYKFVPFTPRQVQTFVQTTDGSMLPAQLITIFIPKFLGSVTGYGTDSVSFWGAPGAHYYWEVGAYLGILPIFLALLGVIYSPRKTKYAFLIISVLAILFALGKYFPLYKLFWYIIPGLSRFRFPSRFISVYTFSTGVLAVFGLEYLITYGDKIKQNLTKFTRFIEIFLIFSVVMYIIFASGAFKSLSQYLSDSQIWQNCLKQFRIFLLFLFLTWAFFIIRRRTKMNTTLLALLAVVISFFDLYSAHHNFSKGATAPSEYYPESRIVKSLQDERSRDVFRIRAREGGYMILKRNEGCLKKLELTEGVGPLSLARYWAFNVPLSRRDEIFNCKYAISIDTIQNRMGLTPVPKYLPRAFMCYDYLVAHGDSEVLGLLRSDTIDLRKTVVLEENPEILPENNPSNPSNPELPNDSVVIQNWQNNYIKTYVRTDQPGFLVMSEMYYPEWKAGIDGKPAKIYCANYILRAVYVPAGEHKIEMYYSKRNITIGALISLITLIFAGVLGLIAYKRNKPKKITG